MKKTQLNRQWILAAGIFAACQTSLFAATFTKIDTSALSLDSGWSGGVVPGATDIALFNSATISANTTFSPGATTLDIGQIALDLHNTASDIQVNINNAATINLYGVNGFGLNNISYQPVGSGNKNATFQLDTGITVNVVNSQKWQVLTRNINMNGILAGGADVTLTKVGAGTLYIGAGGNANINTFAGTLENGGLSTTTINTRFSNLKSLVLSGGITNLNQNNTYTGYTGVDQINNTATLTLGGGNLTITGKINTAVSQAFASTTLSGGSYINLINQGAGSSTTLDLGAITRTTGGILSYVTTGAGTSTLKTSTGTADKILKTADGIAYATTGAGTATQWAAKDSTNTTVVGFTAYDSVAVANTISSADNGKDLNFAPTANATATTAALGTLRLGDVTGDKTLTIASGNTLSTGGILAASNNGAYSINGGSLTALSGVNELVLVNNGSKQLSINSIITDNGSAVSVTGNGTGTINIGNGGTYTGDTYIGSGVSNVVPLIWRMNSAASGNANSTYHVSGNAQLNINNQNTITIGGITGFGTTTIGTGSVNVGGNNASTTYEGVFTSTSAAAAITKAGTGTLRLNGYAVTNAANYSGTVTVSGGTLLVNGSYANAASTIVKAEAALGGSGAVSAVNVESGGILTPGDGGIGTLTAASLTLNSTASLIFDLGSTNIDSDLLSLSGAFNDGTGTADAYHFSFSGGQVGETYTLVKFGSTNFTDVSQFDISTTGYGGSFALDGSSLQFTLMSVPEPSTYLLMGFGAAALGLLRRKRSV